MPGDERLARAALSRVGEPDDERLRRTVAVLGPVEVWEQLRAGSTRLAGEDLSGLAARAAAADPEADLRRVGAAGGRLLCPGDEEWPPGLDDLDPAGVGAPYALWVRGRPLRPLAGRSVAVVGARAATAYGVLVATELGAGLAERGWTVVSGGAYGVDVAAHRGALAVDGATVAVLACGVDVAYPRAHAALFARIAATGALVSEAPPGAAAMRHRFLIRNRLIAALARGTVVVEAAARSGSLSTAGHAEGLSRLVLAVPGPVTSALSVGCHRLLRDRGAVLVTGAADVLDAVGELGADAVESPRGAETARDALTKECRRVLDAVPVRRPAGTASVALAAGLDPRVVTGRLAELVVAGLVEPTGGGWRLASAAAATRSRGP